MMEDYNLRFYDSSISLVGELDDANAVIWNCVFCGYGKFELHFGALHPDCFQINNYVKLDRDRYKTGIIKSIAITESDDGVTAVIKGFTLAWLLTQRITVPPAGSAQLTVTGAAEDAMIALVDASAGPAAEKKRQMGLVMADSRGRGVDVAVASRYKVLSEELTALGEQTGLGYTIYLDTDQKRLVFEVLDGVDRTWGQDGGAAVCFSPKYDNVTTRNYQTNVGTLKNCAYVGGQGEGAERRIIVVGSEASGLDRCEIFVDARDINDTSALTQRGRAKLSGYPAVNSYECDVDPAGYGSKWNLGDYISVKDDAYGMSADMQVSAVEIAIDRTGRRITPTFGVAPKTNQQRLDQLTSTDAVI